MRLAIEVRAKGAMYGLYIVSDQGMNRLVRVCWEDISMEGMVQGGGYVLEKEP